MQSRYIKYFVYSKIAESNLVILSYINEWVRKELFTTLTIEKQKSSGRLWKNIRKKIWKNRVGRRLLINRKLRRDRNVVSDTLPLQNFKSLNRPYFTRNSLFLIKVDYQCPVLSISVVIAHVRSIGYPKRIIIVFKLSNTYYDQN